MSCESDHSNTSVVKIALKAPKILSGEYNLGNGVACVKIDLIRNKNKHANCRGAANINEA